VGKLLVVQLKCKRRLVRDFLEAVYQEALEIEFSLKKSPYKSQFKLKIFYKGNLLKQRYKPDFVIDNKIILEIKSQKFLTEIDEAQVHNYLRATGLKLGLLLNFGKIKVEIKRIIKTR
jgi:GxxExxY protein